LLPDISAIPAEEKLKLIMPPEEALSEGEQLLVIATEDKKQLVGRGLDPMYIDTLDARAGAFGFAAAIYETSILKVTGSEKLWKEKGPLGYALRKKMLHEAGFALRQNEEGLQGIAEIKAGKGHRDMILDLLAIYILCKKYPEDLQKINFDVALIDQAKTLLEELSNAFAGSMVDKESVNEALDIRDKAYTYLMRAMNEIREYGQFVFVDVPERYILYVSPYDQNLGKVAAAAKAQATPAGESTAAE
jgi:hypothetical protein